MYGSPSSVFLNADGLAASLDTVGTVHDLSKVPTPAPPADVGRIAAVQTSCADRKRLKSSTSCEFLPSRKRTFTAFAEAVELTTVSSELYELPAASSRVV